MNRVRGGICPRCDDVFGEPFAAVIKCNGKVAAAGRAASLLTGVRGAESKSSQERINILSLS